MITHWKDIAPENLKGCLMGLPVLKVFHKKDEFKNDFGKDFQLDKDKLLRLFTGNNLYESNLDFIRELVQNAMDANRIQLYYELKLEIKRKFYLKDQDMELEKIKPIDLTKEAYDNFPIDITISECKGADGKIDRSRFMLQISDEGIGVDEEGVNAVAHIGQGWRERSNYTEIINEMRQWLRPTGGFGIGVQSAFLVTDEVVMLTKAAYRDAFRITMHQNGMPNNITVEYAKDIINQGTKIQLAIEFEKLNDPNILKIYGTDYGEDFQKDYFTYEDRMNMVYCIIRNYTIRQFKDTLMPVTVRLTLGKKDYKITIQSKYFFMDSFSGHRMTPDYCAAFEVREGRVEQTADRMAGQSLQAEGIRKYDPARYLETKGRMLREFGFLRRFYEELEGMPVAQNSHIIEEDRLFMHIDPEQQILRLWNDITETFYYIRLVDESPGKEEKIRTLANYKNVGVLEDSSEIFLSNREEWNSCPYITTLLFDVMGRKVEECLIVSRNRFLEKAWKEDLILDQYVRAYFALLREMVNNGFAINVHSWFKIFLITGHKVTESGLSIMEHILTDAYLTVWAYEDSIDGISGNQYEWQKTEVSYRDIVQSINDNTKILAMMATTEEVNDTTVQDGYPEMEEQWEKFCRNVWLIKDEKVSAVLREYCAEQERMVMAAPQSVAGNMPCKALRIVNGEAKPLEEWRRWIDSARKEEESRKTDGGAKSGKEEKAEKEGSGEKENQGKILDFKRTWEEMGDKDRILLPLGVKTLPYRHMEREKAGTIFIIGPYNDEIDRKIKEIMKNAGSRGNRNTVKEKESQERMIRDGLYGETVEDAEEQLMSQKEFLDVVMQDESFDELCRWVHRHQAEPGTYSLEDVRAAYIHYLKRDYQRIRKRLQRVNESQDYGERI